LADGQTIRTGTTGSGTTIGIGEAQPRDDPNAIIRFVGRQIDKAHQYMRQDKPGRARLALDMVDDKPATEAQLAEIRELIKRLNEIGGRWLEQADGWYKAGEYLRSVRMYERVNRNFATLTVGERARGALDRAESDPQCQAALCEIQAERIEQRIEGILAADRARRRRPSEDSGDRGESDAAGPAETPARVASELRGPAEASASESTAADAPTRIDEVRKLPPSRLLTVMNLLEHLIDRFGTTEAADRARTDVAALRNDKALMARLEQFRAKRNIEQDYNRAIMYVNAGMDARAVEHLRAFLEAHPEAPQAPEARKHLCEIEPKPSGPGD
ncbi:MAG: hypothetical protein KGY81_03340, partial [Phycisphaerae bacterium]|nr:hypothetical protein [Phycisphaerae bacterium]